MAYVFRTFACDACGDTFEVMQDRDEGPPPECAKCGYVFDAPKLPIPSGFRITTAGPKAADASVEQYFKATADAAAEAGNPSLKVTDIRTGVRAGESYAMPQSVPQPSQEYQHIMASGMSPMFGGSAQTPSGMQSQESVKALAAQAREQGLSHTGAPTVRGFATDPTAPHRRLTGRFNRADATGSL